VETELIGLTRVNIEGSLVVLSGFVLFAGSTYLLASAVLGRTLGYLVTATGFFAFMIILSALWVFGAPGTPRYLGPKGDLPAWVPVAAGQTLESPTIPVIQRYPNKPWRSAEEQRSLAPELEPATLAFQEFLAEEASGELRGQGIEGEVTAEEFQIEDVRFTEVDGTTVAAGRGFHAAGGPEVTVVGYKDQGNEPLPSYLFLAASVIGFAAHLPFLDRAERRRKDVLTGGDQAPWRGPA
jgi:hypothetical protein